MSAGPIIKCPSCATQLRTPAGAQTIRCPKCQTLLKVPSAGASQNPASTGNRPAPKTAQKPAQRPAPKPSGAAATPIQCGSCNKQFRVAANSAGKRVKCPGCATVLTVPGGPAAPAPQPTASDPFGAADPFGASDQMSGADPFGAAAAPGGGSVFDQIPAGGGYPAATAPAPSPYSQPLSTPQPSGNPYQVTAKSSKSHPQRAPGSPPDSSKLWMIFGGSCVGTFVVTFLLMLVIPPLAAVIALIAYFGGALASSVAGIWLLVIAFQESAVQGLLCLFLPVYIIFYMFKDWSQTWLPAMIYWTSAGVMVAALAGAVLGAVVAA